MRAISFGKVAVQSAGTPLIFGQSFLSAAATAADPTLTVSVAAAFAQDMIPFKMDVDPSNASSERVSVTAISGSTFSVVRGIDGTIPMAHGTSAVVMAKFPMAGWDIGVVAGQTGKTYFGTRNINVSTRAGVIKEFWANPSGTVQVTADQLQFVPVEANPLNLTDFAMDVAVSGEGMHVTFWVK